MDTPCRVSSEWEWSSIQLSELGKCTTVSHLERVNGIFFSFRFLGATIWDALYFILNVGLPTFLLPWGPETWPIVYADQKVINLTLHYMAAS